MNSGVACMKRREKVVANIKSIFLVAILTLIIAHLYILIASHYIYDGNITTCNLDYYELAIQNRRIFPNEIDKNNVIKFNYSSYGDNKKSILLIIKYDNNDFYNTIKTFEKGEYKYDNYYFNYPTYILKYYKSNNLYEYACVDENNETIIYVYFYKVKCEEIVINVDYLPKEYISESEVLEYD